MTWGRTAFGQSGVEAVVNILNRELSQIMRHRYAYAREYYD